MAIRLRIVDGVRVALCAAKTKAEFGDIYLDDGWHYTISQKYWRDYDEIEIVDLADIALAASIEADEAIVPDHLEEASCGCYVMKGWRCQYHGDP